MGRRRADVGEDKKARRKSPRRGVYDEEVKRPA